VGLALIFIALALFMTFGHAPECSDFECFQREMRDCEKTKFINEQSEATWRYEILGSEGRLCQVEVKLLQPKAGELGIDRLSGLDMVCEFPKGIADYPEKDLARCHGILKEELQAITIKKLHTYLIENLGEIDSGLKFFSPKISLN
jgi:hypothetical protein